MAAVSTCVLAYQRVFEAARVTGSAWAAGVVTPAMLGCTVRAMALAGEALWQIDVEAGAPRLLAIDGPTHVQGGPDEST